MADMKTPLIHITEHSGKMKGIRSISTSVLLNAACKKNAENKKSICAYCYAVTLCKFYGEGLQDALAGNTAILSGRVLTDEELPVITDKWFRFESFGDLNNDIQMINYMNIVKKNPGTRFSLYTKRYKIVYDYFKANDVPENFTLVLSSFLVNHKINLDSFKKLGKFKKGQLKSFTVYDKKYFKAHKGFKPNCGARSCFKCSECYRANETEEISEILKKDQSQVLFDLNWQEESYRANLASKLEDGSLSDLIKTLGIIDPDAWK